MAKFITVCYKKSHKSIVDIKDQLLCLSQNLVIESFTPNPSKIIADGNLISAIINPTSIQKVVQNSICVGIMTEDIEDWHKPGGGVPDGNYALIRSDKSILELVSDASATRAIWYYKDDNIFIASSSQRAIISLIGSFEPNKETYSWFLASGFHGPEMGWDKRITYVKSNHSSIILDRNTWSLEEKTNDIVFKNTHKKDSQNSIFFEDSLRQNIGDLNLNFRKWWLPLSGGFDSRSLLLLLKNKKVKTISWGLKKYQHTPLSDTAIAKKLSEKFKVENQFYPINHKIEKFEQIFDNFLKIGEGRIDTIAGYLDSFEVWKTFFEEGIEGVIRGDLPVSQGEIESSTEGVWRRVDSPDLEGFFPPNLIKTWSLTPRVIPSDYKMQENESFTSYRDRLFIQFRTPAYISAQNDLKALYTEILAPYITRNVINTYTKLPDHLRANKILLKQFVLTNSNKIPFASVDNLANIKVVLREQSVIDFMIKIIKESNYNQVLSKELVEYIALHLNQNVNQKFEQRDGFRKSSKRFIKKFIPDVIINKIKKKPYNLDIYRFAFRACIIVEMNNILAKDAEMFKQKKAKQKEFN